MNNKYRLRILVEGFRCQNTKIYFIVIVIIIIIIRHNLLILKH